MSPTIASIAGGNSPQNHGRLELPGRYPRRNGMKLTHLFDVRFRWHLPVATILTAMSAYSQTIQLTQPAEPGFPAASGQYLAVPELPQPEWREEMGAPVARLRLAAPNAAAWSVAFESLGLGKDAQMFVYGMNTAGSVSAVHGPYEKNGPLNVPGFETRIIEGVELVIEVRGALARPSDGKQNLKRNRPLE
jgi:hypothetical protein